MALTTANQPTTFDVMVQVARHIERHCDQPLTLEQLGAFAGMSPSMLQKQFLATFGVTPKAYHSGKRREVFRAELTSGASVTQATYAAGYGSSSRVPAKAGANLGMPPSAYQAGGVEQRIHWVIRNGPLGPLMMAATDRGVCCVQFGESHQALEQSLQSEFPKASLVAAKPSGQLNNWFDLLEDYLAARAPKPQLPVDLRGSAFQVLVWRFLLSIPDGQTRSYQQVAQGIGRPKSFRAVANACGANRVAILVPCHRVLRSGGQLGGYRWGIDTKKRLLDIEQPKSSGQ